MRYVCAIAVVAVLGMLLVPSVMAEDSEADDNTYDFNFSITWYKDFELNEWDLDLSAKGIVGWTSTTKGDLLDAPDMSRYIPSSPSRDYAFVGWVDYDFGSYYGAEWWAYDYDFYYQFFGDGGYLSEVTKEYVESQYANGRTSLRLVALYTSVPEQEPEDTGIGWTTWLCVGIVAVCLIYLAYVGIRNR